MTSASAARKSLAAAQQAASKDETAKKTVSSETYIDLDVTDTSGRRFTGRFKYRVPNLSAIVEIGKLKALLAAGQNLAVVDPASAGIVEVTAYLEVTIDHSAPGTPSWWQETDHGSRLYDFTPLRRLYEEVRSYEERFHGGGKKRGESEAAAPAPEEPGDAGDAGADALGESVQPEPAGPVVLAGDGARSSGMDRRG
jgi:hypothetical protein